MKQEKIILCKGSPSMRKNIYEGTVALERLRTTLWMLENRKHNGVIGWSWHQSDICFRLISCFLLFLVTMRGITQIVQSKDKSEDMFRIHFVKTCAVVSFGQGCLWNQCMHMSALVLCSFFLSFCLCVFGSGFVCVFLCIYVFMCVCSGMYMKGCT